MGSVITPIQRSRLAILSLIAGIMSVSIASFWIYLLFFTYASSETLLYACGMLSLPLGGIISITAIIAGFITLKRIKAMGLGKYRLSHVGIILSIPALIILLFYLLNLKFEWLG